MTWALLAVPLAPLAAAALVALLGRALPGRGGWLVTAACAGSLVCLLELGPEARAIGAVWARPGGLALTAGLQIDGLSWAVAVLVASIALVVQVYALRYMAAERGRQRFFAWMGVFVGAMLALVLARSLLVLFAAWELVGVASVALIGFRYRDVEACSAARKAFLLTRAGDLGLLVVWLLALVSLGTTDIAPLVRAAAAGDLPVPAELLAALILAAAVGKSAQLPLGMWLPDAMIGPTPVSALIHSATMVAAGVYLVLRLFPVFEAAPVVLDALAWIGVVTAVLAALVATAERDLKRILAWSTMSQLGAMMLALGLRAPAHAAHHLVVHAVFKSGLFLAAGAVERATGTRYLQDLGGLGRRMPVTAAGLVVCALALAAVPPLSGYWSESRILASAVTRGPWWGAAVVLVVFLAALYIARTAAAALGRWPGMSRPSAREVGPGLVVPLLALSAGALVVGWATSAPLDRLLGRAPSHHGPTQGWESALIAASITGLVAGVVRVRHRGPVPALGAWPLHVANALDVATRAPATAALAIARFVAWVERALDGLALACGLLSRAWARAVDVAERALDRGACAAARAVQVFGHAVEIIEARGFASGGDRLAGALGAAGQQLRRLQTGKIYLYVMSLFGWVLLAGLAAVIVRWRGCGAPGGQP